MNLRMAVWMLATVVALFAMPIAAPAAEEPEAVFAKFHNAGLTANYEDMRKYGTAAGADDFGWMPAWLRQPILRFFAKVLPKTYTVAGKTLTPDGNGATLSLTAMVEGRPGEKPDMVTGTAVLVKEKGEWKVERENWGSQ